MFSQPSKDSDIYFNHEDMLTYHIVKNYHASFSNSPTAAKANIDVFLPPYFAKRGLTLQTHREQIEKISKTINWVPPQEAQAIIDHRIATSMKLCGKVITDVMPNRLDIPDNSVGFTLSHMGAFNSMRQFSDALNYAEELTRVTKPGGIILLGAEESVFDDMPPELFFPGCKVAKTSQFREVVGHYVIYKVS